MSEAYSRRFDDAVALALDGFRGITRKGSGAPYITHLFAVTALVGEHGGDEDQLIAAMLHDAIEDVPGIDRATLEARFGARVARLVVALSDCEGEDPKPPWKQRKVAYLTHLRHQPAEVKLISCADKLHNAQSIVVDHGIVGSAIFDRFTGGREGTLWYYGSLPEILGNGWDSPLLRALSRTVDALLALR